MQISVGQRTLSVMVMGSLFLVAPGLALDKSAPQAPRVRPVMLTTSMIASWYGDKFQGKLTASGELFDQNKLTAAHKSLPLGSLVRLTARATGRSIVVRINDRGPWIKGRDLDLSEAAAIALGIHDFGISVLEVTLTQSEFAALAGAQKH
jgi:rare lipoprotein A (peptidoglycan hydrolase)